MILNGLFRSPDWSRFYNKNATKSAVGRSSSRKSAGARLQGRTKRACE